ncbi:hypothetical protein [Aquitalea sp.]|uniref:hypothetical protein n=1 Tax=Aquitalea sp. TaxID=1872623 RepID=UPI0025850E57|nr:hypothetical protein [Aquitalea sp.]
MLEMKNAETFTGDGCEKIAYTLMAGVGNNRLVMVENFGGNLHSPARLRKLANQLLAIADEAETIDFGCSLQMASKETEL